MLLIASGWEARPALGDGDPASDVLATQTLFLAQDARVPPGQAAQLGAVLQEAGRLGYPIRLALIASTGDLGSVTELWRKPQTYAEFLGQELSLVYRGPLLVVMPDGLGFYQAGHSLATSRSAVAGISLRPGRELGATALAAVRQLAAAAGHELALPRAPRLAAAGSDETIPGLVFGAGCLLIALAWGASIRIRPLAPRRNRLPTT